MSVEVASRGRLGPRVALLAATPLLPVAAAALATLSPAAATVARWVLPVVTPLTLYAALAVRVRRGAYESAWQLGIAWASLLSLGVIVAAQLMPVAAGAAIWHGPEYRHEMFGWIATGLAPENDWRQFVPIHVEHLALFVLLSWVSGAYLGLVLGAALVDYMSYFVGSYAAAAGHPVLGSVAAWVPWSVLRVMAFVLLGCLFARPLLVRRAWPFERRELRLMALAGCGLVADIAVKATLAPTYGLWLRHMARAVIAALYSGASGVLA